MHHHQWWWTRLNTRKPIKKNWSAVSELPSHPTPLPTVTNPKVKPDSFTKEGHFRPHRVQQSSRDSANTLSRVGQSKPQRLPAKGSYGAQHHTCPSPEQLYR